MDDPVDTKILALCQERGAGKSICPSDVAKALVPEGRHWQHLMGRVRQRAIVLARGGAIDILRKGKPVADLDDLRGVIRLRIR
ncbi:MAG: DUF3253 domain-containing protein [Alphaproteobacteria bacterium]|nr:DUF3253 domain-containing protein [Alphaproteobacteria bacterium]